MTFSPVVASNQADLLRERVSAFFQVQPGLAAFFSESLLDQRGWAAVLYECDFKAPGAGRVARACERFGYSSAVCFNLDGNQDKAYHLSLSVDDLAQVHNLYFSPSYAIVEERESFLIVSDSDYYWAVAGEVSFLQEITGQSLAEVLDEFAAGIAPYVTSPYPHEQAIGGSMASYLALCRKRLASITQSAA